jgi:hypothetical protein
MGTHAANQETGPRSRPDALPQPLAPVPGTGQDTCMLPVRCLLAADSPRCEGEDARHIQVLFESEAPLPPILVHRQTMRVIDGMHRLRVALLKAQHTIEVRFFDGTEAEAFAAAVKANVTHGLPLSLADREAAARRLISAYPERSDRWIAATAGLAAGTVAAIRRAASHDDPTTVRIGRDGRVRPLSTASGRQLASNEIARRPNASLRDIAKVAGISPATVRDVRERLRRGEDPVPPSQAGRQPGCQARPSPLRERAAMMGRPGSHFSAPARDLANSLQRLRKDPSLRHTESGRALLRWLETCARGPGQWQDLINGIAPHCFYAIAQIARSCADEWLAVAAQLENQLREIE